MFKRFFRRAPSLKVSLLCMTLLCWLLPTAVLGAFMVARVFPSIREKTEAAMLLSAGQAYELLTNDLDGVVALARNVTYDGELTDASALYQSGALRYQDFLKQARSYLERKFSREENCAFAMFFRAEDPTRPVYSTKGYDSALAFGRDALGKVLLLCETLDTRPLFYQSGDTLCLIRNLYDTKLNRYGVFVLGLDTDALFRKMREPVERLNASWALSLDGCDFGELMDGPAETLFEKDGLLCYSRQDKGFDYDLTFQIKADRNEVYAEMAFFERLLMLLTALLVPVCLLILWFVQKRIIRPVKILADASARIERGELGVVVPMHGQDELGRLGSAFSAMSVQIRELIDKSYKEEIALRDARIQAMQSRINPHFLFNALEIINWQARMDQNDTVANMVSALSVLLDACLDRSERHLVPLREELKVSDAYFLFVGLRFLDKLTVEKRIDPAALELLMPRLAVQTLLENAVEHGIAPAGGGHILLEITVDERVNVRVQNDGAPVSDDTLERMRDLLREDGDAGGHVGLNNVAQRLRLLFGRAAIMRVERTEAGETAVLMSIEKEQCQPQSRIDKPRP